mgnify:CR=1 FL=1
MVSNLEGSIESKTVSGLIPTKSFGTHSSWISRMFNLYPVLSLNKKHIFLKEFSGYSILFSFVCRKNWDSIEI